MTPASLFFGLLATADRPPNAVAAGVCCMSAALLGAIGLFRALRWLGRIGRSNAWRSDPATDRQKDFADELGIKYKRNVTKGELSDMISRVTGR